MKKIRKIIAVLLTVLTLISVISAATPVLATEVTELTENAETISETSETTETENAEIDSETAETETSEEQATTNEPEVLTEIVEWRTESTKYFRNSDGSYTAAQYAYPVHYKENSEWKEIDNTLTAETVGESVFKAEKEFVAKNTNTPAKFPDEFKKDGSKKITVSAEGYDISFSPKANQSGIKNSDGKIKDREDLDSVKILEKFNDKKEEKASIFKATKLFEKAEQKNEKDEKFKVENKSGVIAYEDVFDNVDLEYELNNSQIKESIILEEKQDEYVFEFEMDLGGLRPVICADGSINLCSDEDCEEAVAKIEAPYMVASDGEYSDAVTMTIEEAEEDYILTVTADEAWLNADERAYPVIIDPTIKLHISKLNTIDSYIDTSDPDYSFYGDFFLYAGHSSSGKTRTYIKFKLPELPNDNYMITNAYITFWQKSAALSSSSQGYLNLYEVKGYWDNEVVSARPTWNNRPNCYNEILDYAEMKFGEGINYRFDITKSVKKWYENNKRESNYGFMLKSSNESVVNRVQLYSAENASDNYPSIYVTFCDNKGLEEYWNYSSYSIGSAGAAYVNDYTGNLVYELPILSSISEKAPLTLTAYFNNYCANKTLVAGKNGSSRTTIGMGFRLSIQQTVLPSSEYIKDADFNETYPYVYTDADGTEHYFVKDTKEENVYVDEEGLGLKLKTREYVTPSSVTAAFQITDKAHNNYYFNSEGNLGIYHDNNGNEIKITFVSPENNDNFRSKTRILKITDGAGHTFRFNYYDTDSGNLVESITDNAGRTVTFDISDSCLKGVSYPNGDEVDIAYKSKERATIDYIQSNNSYRLGLYYTTAAQGTRVKKVTEYAVKSNGDIEEKGQSVTFDRSKYNTTIIRSCGLDGIHNEANTEHGDDDIITTVQFDNMGRAISQQMEFGSGAEIGAGSVGYTSSSDDSTTSGFKNKVSVSGATGKYVENLLLGGNAEEYGPWIFYRERADKSEPVDAEKSISEVSHYIGKKSIKLTINEVEYIGDRCFYKQDFDNVQKNTSYTLSAYAKTGDLEVKHAGLTGAFIQIKGFDSDGNEIESVNSISQVLTERSDLDVNEGWRRLSCTVETTSKVAFLRCYLVLRNVVGPVCFDGIQLEKGSTANDYNMLENSNFSYASNGVPTSWEGTTQFVFQSGVNGVVDSDDLPDNFNESDSYYKDIISKAVRMTGTPGVEKGVCQYVPVEGNPNDTYILSGWAKGFPVNSTFHTTGSGDNKKGIATFEIAVKVIYSGSDGEKHAEFKTPASFNTTITDWQCASVPISLKSTEGEDGITYTPTEIKIIPRYHNQENFVFFDKIMLVKDSTSSYTYDSDGNLTGTRSSPEHKASMEYDDNDNLTSYKDIAGYTTKLSYDDKNNLILTESAKGVYYKDTNNTEDHIRTYDTRNADTIADSTGAIRTAVKYNDEPITSGSTTINAGSYIVGEYDENKNYTEYTRDTKTGVIKKVTNPEEVSTYYEYIRDYTMKRSVSVRNSKVVYGYDDYNRLESIRFGEKDDDSEVGVKDYEKYQFKYDEFGNVEETSIGEQYLSKNTYGSHNGPLTETAYGNGDKKFFVYNNLGQLRSEKAQEYSADNSKPIVTRYSYIYNSSGALQYISDKKNDIRTIVDYDSLGRLSKSELADDNTLEFIGSTEYAYDKRGNVSKLVTNYGGVSHTQKYLYGTTSLNDNSESYKKDGLASAYQLYSTRYAVYDYDSLNRFTQRKLTLENPLYYNYTFNSSDRNEGSETKFRTTQVDKEFVGDDVFLYYYNDLGNITSIRKADRKVAGSNTTTIDNTKAYRTYEYDDLGQLIRENNITDDKTYTYQYDKLGNIENKKVYDFTTESVDGEASELLIDYNYEQLTGSDGNDSWRKALVSVDLNGSGKITSDETISYDRIGNPTTYLGATLTWFGRQLTSYTKGNTDVSYKYNADGLRTEKIVDGVKHQYVYIGDQLHYEKRGSKNIFYFYDCNGYLTGLEYDGTTYYPATTLNGDVVAIYNNLGECLAKYEYDAWGNVLSVKNASGNDITDENHIANVNPIRYRGYYYDRETGLYYLQSRYYDPSIGRFINADTIDVLGVSPDGLTDKNLFAYCDNNPITRADSGGEVWHIVAGGLIGGVIGGISSIVGQAVSGQKINWAEVGISAASGALTGAITAACPGMGAVATGIVHGVVGAGTHVATELVHGSTPTVAGTLAAGVTSGVLAGGTRAVGNLVNKGVKIQKIGRLEASNHANNPQLGVKYQINKPNGRPTTRSIEFHYNHSHNGYKPHWQQNSWNPLNNAVSSMKHWTWWGKRI